MDILIKRQAQFLKFKEVHCRGQKRHMKYTAAVVIFCIGLISCQRIINNSYKKTVYFTGSVVREEHLIDLQVADETPAPSDTLPADLIEEIHQNWFPNYVFVVPPSQADQLAGWEARMVSMSSQDTDSLMISEITKELPSCQKNGYRCLNAVLPMDGKLNKHFWIVISLAFLNQIEPKPEIQKDLSVPARFFYRSESFDPVSVYRTDVIMSSLVITAKSKSLKLKCPIGRKPEKMSDSGLSAGMKGFTCSGAGNGPVEFRFESKDAIMLTIKSLSRKYTYLPWSGEVQVSESYEFVHKGPKQPESPSFSRFEFGQILHRLRGNLDGLQLTPQVMVVVPSGAYSIEARDEVGINWNEMKVNSFDSETDFVSLPLRFPLIGGMSVAFDFSYKVKAGNLIKPFKSTSSPFKKLIHMKMFKNPLDFPVEKFKLTFVLPEDSNDIEYELESSKPVKVSKRSYRTYFSTTGEKEISFEFEDMTREDLEKAVAILFNFPFWGTFRKPLVALSSLVFLIIGALYLNRLDLSFKEKKRGDLKEKGKQSGNCALKLLFAKRKEILMNFEDLIAGNVNTNSTSEQLRSDKNLRRQLNEQLNSLEHAIFEKIKVNFEHVDPQRMALNSMALKRLYDEQGMLCQKLLIGANSEFDNNSFDSLSNSGSKSLDFSFTRSIGDVNKMSRSDSAGGLVAPNKDLESFSEEAVKLDAQICEYEAKFIV